MKDQSDFAILKEQDFVLPPCSLCSITSLSKMQQRNQKQQNRLKISQSTCSFIPMLPLHETHLTERNSSWRETSAQGAFRGLAKLRLQESIAPVSSISKAGQAKNITKHLLLSNNRVLSAVTTNDSFHIFKIKSTLYVSTVLGERSPQSILEGEVGRHGVLSLTKITVWWWDN